MALKPCYECNKDISTKAIMCPQCGALQNPASDLIGKTTKFVSTNTNSGLMGKIKRFVSTKTKMTMFVTKYVIKSFGKTKRARELAEELNRMESELEWNNASPARRRSLQQEYKPPKPPKGIVDKILEWFNPAPVTEYFIKHFPQGYSPL